MCCPDVCHISSCNLMSLLVRCHISPCNLMSLLVRCHISPCNLMSLLVRCHVSPCNLMSLLVRCFGCLFTTQQSLPECIHHSSQSMMEGKISHFFTRPLPFMYFLICKLQKGDAHLICCSARSDHISSDPSCSALASCQILCSVKTVLHTFKSLNNQALSYLSDVMQLYVRSCQLCSSADAQLLFLSSARLDRVFWLMCLLLLSTITLEQSALLCLTLLSWHHLSLPLRPISFPQNTK